MKTVLNVKTDKDIKEKAQKLAAHLGVPLSTIVNAQLKAFIESGEFTLKREPSLQSSVVKIISKQIKESTQKKNTSPEFSDVDKALNWLHS